MLYNRIVFLRCIHIKLVSSIVVHYKYNQINDTFKSQYCISGSKAKNVLCRWECVIHLTVFHYKKVIYLPYFCVMKMNKPEIRDVNIIRYVQPFREGGSLPALVDADDGFSYVIKFRGAGQGKKALVAELIGGELARLLGLRMPEMVFAELDESFARTEPDEEIQDLLRFSVGKNLGVHFLRGAITFDANVDEVSADEASKIVWLDALLMNVDRT